MLVKSAVAIGRRSVNLHRVSSPYYHHQVSCRLQHHSLILTKSITTYNTNESNPNIIIQGTIPSNGEEIQVGQFAVLCRTFSQRDVYIFGNLVGDMNPVHFPQEDRDNTQHGSIQQGDKPIVHGILLASVFSTIFGTIIPRCIYRSQSFKFYHPVRYDEQIIGKVVVTKLRQINRSGGGVLCTCDTTLHKIDDNTKNGDMMSISGSAEVWIPRMIKG